MADPVLSESPVAASCRHQAILPVSRVVSVLAWGHSPTQRAVGPARRSETDDAAGQSAPRGLTLHQMRRAASASQQSSHR
jgi:hypothetical protein